MRFKRKPNRNYVRGFGRQRNLQWELRVSMHSSGYRLCRCYVMINRTLNRKGSHYNIINSVRCDRRGWKFLARR